MRLTYLLSSVLLLLASQALAFEGTFTASGEPLSWEELVRRAGSSRIVYVGEEHGKRSHHQLQRDLLEAMADSGAPVVLGCEYFPRSLQPVLDRFNRGEIPLEQFREAIGWDEVWGYPYGPYAPLFQLCHERRIPLVALNEERELVTRVRRQGLKSLELHELLDLPRMDLKMEEHRERIVGLLQEAHPLPPEALDRYYQAFTLWDEAMAESVCETFLRDRRPDLKMLVVAGRAHIETGTGVPERVSRRLPGARLIVVCGEADAQAGDVLALPNPGRRWF